MATYERLDYGSDDGSRWGGASSDALGMYGAVPVVRYGDAGAASSYVISHATSPGSTYGFSTAAMFTSMVLQVSSLTTALRNIGLIT